METLTTGTSTSSPPSSSVLLSIALEKDVETNFKRLVYEQYQQRNWLDTADYPDKIVTDQFDDDSDILVVQSGDEIIAGMRIVKDMGKGFPHERELNLDQFRSGSHYEHEASHILANTPRCRMAEITKVVGKKKKRMLTFDIVKCLYWYALRNDIDLYVVVIDMEFFLLCDTLGVPINPIGTPVYCEGSWTIPAITIPSRYPHAISAKSPSGWSYIAAPDNLDGTWTKH